MEQSFQKRPDEPKEYFPLTDQVIHDHLTGKLTAGVYPLLTDETCWFLAADFDKTTWQDDVRAFLQTCADWNIPAALERSRSGRGGHVWIFFDAPLPASLARKLGAAILTGQWSGVTSLVSILTTVSFQARIRCRKAALAISSRCRCNTCRAATATVFFSPMILIRIPISGHSCRASGGCHLPKLKRWCGMLNAAVKSSASGAVSPTTIQTKTRGRCRRRGRKRISRFPARCRRV
jgi:hypothetical protein